MKQVYAFLQIPAVQRALTDDMYRLGEFRKPWSRAPRGIGEDMQHFSSYDEVAAGYHLAANNTQKMLAEKKSPVGMREMTVIQEWMNLLTNNRGNTLNSTFETAGFVVPTNIRSIQGLTIHAVLAVIKRLTVTRGPLDRGTLEADLPFDETFRRGPVPNPQDPLKTESHALHVIVSHDNNHLQRKIPRINPIGSAEQLRHGYSYGVSPSKETVDDRLQGARFRAMQLREYARQVLPQAMAEQEWQRPRNSMETTLMAEVCTEKALDRMRPDFFSGQWGIGVVAPSDESVCVTSGNLRGQIERALPHITKTILHYPPDNPVVRTA
jgi:hypothetical protein